MHRDALISIATRGLARVFPHHALAPLVPPPRRVLILKPCCLGDLLMATATIRALRLAYPDMALHFAVGTTSAVAVRGSPRLDAILDIEGVGAGRAPWSAYQAVVTKLRAGHYDLAITLDRSPIIGLLPLLAGVPRRVGLDSDGRGFAHQVRVPAPPADPRHEADVYLATVRALGLAVADPRLEFFPSADDEQALAHVHPSTFTPHPLVVIHPAGGVNPGMTLLAKRWPAERFAALADRLIDAQDAQVVLVGGPGDTEVSAAVRQAMRREVVDLTARLSFGAVGALARRAALYIGNDTGATHLAVAVGAPTLMIMGPTDPRRYGPYRPTAPDTVAAVAPPDARPADYLALRHAAAAPDGPTAITRVSVDQVYTVATRLLHTPR